MKEQEIKQFIKLEIKSVAVGEWDLLLGQDVQIEDSTSLQKYLERLFSSYTGSYKPESNMEYFFYEKTGMPSPIIRVDMPLKTKSVSLGQGFYEIEARPAGLGVDSLLFEDHKDIFRKTIDNLRDQLGRKIAVKMFPYIQNPVNDPSGEKAEFARLMGIDFFHIGEEPDDLDDYYFLTYGNSGSLEDLQRFEERSLFPVRDDGNKDYLVQMGAASIADVVSVSRKLSLDAAFILKPRKGMWAQNVLLYTGKGSKKRVNGFAEKDDVVRLIESGNIEDFLLQGFITPGNITINGSSYLAMARIYAIADLSTKKYIAKNGIYIARQNIRLHGTSDAITGRLIL